MSSLQPNNAKTLWNKRQPGVLASPSPTGNDRDCNSNHIRVPECDSQHKHSRHQQGRKRKFNAISMSSPNLFVSPLQPRKMRRVSDINRHNQKKIDLFSFNSPDPSSNELMDNADILSEPNMLHLFTPYDEDQTPLKHDHRMTKFQRQRVLNPVCPSSSSRSSSSSNIKKKTHKLVVQYDDDDDDDDDGDGQKEPESVDFDYFDDDLDDHALLMALNGIDTKPVLDLSPNSKRKANSQQHSQQPCTQQHIATPPSSEAETGNDRYYRFRVTEVVDDRESRSKILRVSDLRQSKADNPRQNIDVLLSTDWTVEIRQDWYDCDICTDDIIHVIGETVDTLRTSYLEQNRQRHGIATDHTMTLFPDYMTPNENLPIIIDTEYDIIIDNMHNYIVIHPDVLMIPSRIATSFHCVRKEILDHNIKEFKQNAVMLYGTMAHELFQETLQEAEFNEFHFQKAMKQVILKHLIELYSIQETEETAKAKLSEFQRNTHDFFRKYMQAHPALRDDSNVVDWSSFKQKLQVTKVIDIEENIWSPMFGMCGQIDATLQIKTQRHLTALEARQKENINNQFTQSSQTGASSNEYKLLPFELKTGKESATGVMQARAQLALYSLMLADRYDTRTNGGLLYYLKTGHLMGIPLPHNEIRALLIQRNKLAKYFNSHPQVEDERNDDDETKEWKQTEEDDDVSKALNSKRRHKEFPPMLSVHQKRTCLSCYAKQECFLYHKVHSYNQGVADICDDNITSNKVYAELTSHVNETHLEYINKWIELIDLEESSSLGTRYEIWAMSSMQREQKSGKCLANMIITDHEFDQFKHIYTFIKHPDYCSLDNGGKYNRQQPKDRDIIKLWDLKFRVNDRIVIGTEDGKFGLAKGSIIELNTKYVKFASYKPIKDLSQFVEYSQCSQSTQQRDTDTRYRLDIDDSAYNFPSLRANVFYYFCTSSNDKRGTKTNSKSETKIAETEHTEIDELKRRKRELLVDLLPPQFAINHFHNQIPLHLQEAYKALNIDQQNAVQHVMKCQDYALILGMPGTGKSATIIFILRLLSSYGYKVLLSAYTNSAIDHLCLKLMKHSDVKEKFARIGNALSINSKLAPYVLDSSNADKLSSVDAIDKYLQSKCMFAVTSTSSTSHAIFQCSQLFDYCIVDEAGQLTEPQVLGPLRKCRRFILVGDSNQLPPLVQSREAEKKGMAISLFEKLAQKHGHIACKSLTIQYRMNKDILLLSNSLIYDGKMKCASHSISAQQIKLNKDCATGSIAAWLQHALDPNHRVILFNTDKLNADDVVMDNTNNTEMKGKKRKKSRNKTVNEHEANMIEMIVHQLFRFGVYSSQIGVMAPYRSQLKLIKSKLDKLNVPLSPSSPLSQQEIVDYRENKNNRRESSLLLDTVDRFQGSDRDVIIISFTHTRSDKKVGQILHDWRRINVALTRAKCKLILIASVDALKQSNSYILKRLVDISNQQKWIYHLDAY